MWKSSSLWKFLRDLETLYENLSAYLWHFQHIIATEQLLNTKDSFDSAHLDTSCGHLENLTFTTCVITSKVCYTLNKLRTCNFACKHDEPM